MAGVMLTSITKINNIKMINIDYVSCSECKPRKDVWKRLFAHWHYLEFLGQSYNKNQAIFSSSFFLSSPFCCKTLYGHGIL